LVSGVEFLDGVVALVVLLGVFLEFLEEDRVIEAEDS